jgi:hypothetical protein
LKSQILLYTSMLTSCEEWMDSFAYACVTVNKPINDVDDLWKPFVPAWYLARATSSGASHVSLSTAITATNPPTIAPVTSKSHLTEGAVTGVAVGGVLAFGAMAICGIFYWRAREKLKRKSKENAEIADALQDNGFTRRIDQLNYGISSDVSVVAPIVQYDAYGHDAHGHLKPQVPTHLYNLAPVPKPAPAPAANIRRSRSSHNMDTAAVGSSPDPYGGHYKSSAMPEPVQNPSNHSHSRSSPDSLGTTAVTTTALQRYSIDPYQAHKPYTNPDGGSFNCLSQQASHRTSREFNSKTTFPASRYSQRQDVDEITPAKPPMYDKFGRKITYR